MFSQRESCRTCVIIDLKDVFFWESNGTHYNIRFILAQVWSLCISRSSCVIQFNSEFNTSRTILTSDPQPTRVCVSVCVCAEMTGSTETHYSCALSQWFMCRLQPLLQKHRQRAALGKLSIGECFYLCVCLCMYMQAEMKIWFCLDGISLDWYMQGEISDLCWQTNCLKKMQCKYRWHSLLEKNVFFVCLFPYCFFMTSS